MKEVAKNSEEWHIDATYKILKNGRGLWIISTKEKNSQKVFPLLFFLIPNEKASTLSIVLEKYKNWVGDLPQTFIADCQKSIKKSVKATFDDSKFFLCIFHILRATKKKISQYYSNENDQKKCFNKFYEIAMRAFDEEDLEEKINEFKTFLNSTNSAAFEYFNENYLKEDKPKEWAKSYREEFSMTNNISEALKNFGWIN